MWLGRNSGAGRGNRTRSAIGRSWAKGRPQVRSVWSPKRCTANGPHPRFMAWDWALPRCSGSRQAQAAISFQLYGFISQRRGNNRPGDIQPAGWHGAPPAHGKPAAKEPSSQIALWVGRKSSTILAHELTRLEPSAIIVRAHSQWIGGYTQWP